MDIPIEPRATAPFQGPFTDMGQDAENPQRRPEDAPSGDRNVQEAAPRRTTNPDVNAPAAFVYRPARNPTQSGPRTRKWVLQREATRPLTLEPLMGWTSGDDPARHIRLEFSTREAAVAFGKAQGWRVYVLPEKPRKPVLMSYRDNFAFKQPQSAETDTPTSTNANAKSRAASDNRSCGADETKDRNRKPFDSLDEALESTFPASDPLPFWSGRIGPPARIGGATA